MKANLMFVLGLLLSLNASTQVWSVFGSDTINHDCTRFSYITIFNNSLWTGLSELHGSNFELIEAPAFLFKCDMSAVDNNGNIWFVGSISPDIWSTHGNALTVYKYNGTDWFEYSLSASFGYSVCSSMAFQNDSVIWFTTVDKGAFMFNGTDWQQFINPSAFDGANAMDIDNDGTIWFATQKGLVKLDGNNWTTFNASNSGLKINIVNDLVIDNSGSIWLATGTVNDTGDATGRIVKFDGVNWDYFEPYPESTVLNYANTIAIDSLGKIWVGTFKGLSVFDGFTWRNYHYPQSVSNDLQVNSIDFDNDGSIWLATDCGIWQIENIPTSINNFTAINSVTMFPNPAGSYITINALGQYNNSEVTILDLNGSLVLKKNIFGEKAQFDITHLKQGVYLVYVNTSSDNFVKKLIKE